MGHTFFWIKKAIFGLRRILIAIPAYRPSLKCLFYLNPANGTVDRVQKSETDLLPDKGIHVYPAASEI
jgi:hypothetical protein